MRFTLIGLLAFVTAIGVALGCLRTGTTASLDAVNLLFVGSIAFAAAAAWLVRRSQRAYWIGAAAAGWAYWLVISVGLLERTGMDHIDTGLPTDSLVAVLTDVLRRKPDLGDHVWGARPSGLGLPGPDEWSEGTVLETDDPQYLIQWDDGIRPRWTRIRPTAETRTYERSAHSLVGMVLATAGGVLATLACSPRLRRGRPATEWRTTGTRSERKETPLAPSLP
ncbi:MAG TPA: hypothetical protein VFB80_12020 [Pirellulaceae bacterium]|nr:hypothetical protein [Pirellulaceae bacterium]